MADVHGDITCPCCGYKTLGEREAWEICPICFWEDEPITDPYVGTGGPNGSLSPYEAQQNFVAIGLLIGDRSLMLGDPPTLIRGTRTGNRFRHLALPHSNYKGAHNAQGGAQVSQETGHYVCCDRANRRLHGHAIRPTGAYSSHRADIDLHNS